MHIIFYFLTLFCISEKQNCEIPIAISEWPVVIDLDRIQNDTLYDSNYKNVKLYIKLFDCRGKLYIEKYQNSKLILKGNYEIGLDTLKKQIMAFDLSSLKHIVIVKKYFEGIKEGKWEYFSKKGKITKVEHYEKGVIIKTEQ